MMENSMQTPLANVAYIDDDRLHLEALVEKFKKKGLAVQTFIDAQTALSFINKNPDQFKIVIVDFLLGEARGDQVVRAIKTINSNTHAVILSSELNRQIIKICQVSGADQVYDKRSTSDVLLRLSEVAKLKIKTRPQSRIEMDRNAEVIQSVLDLSGRSGALVNVAQRVQIYSQAKENVFILGKSGVGKEKIAQAIHFNSKRKDAPFIAVNCGAISDDLVQSELFGHKKGSFSGAIYDKKGCFEEANGGTIFLDEIGEMPLHRQVSLLRVLQEKKITRVGESLSIKINVRVIAATNRDITELINEGKFREDLYYRLNVLPLFIPPLSERKEDIEPVARFVVANKNKETHQKKNISSESIEYLESQVWRGNIREMESVIKRAYAETDEMITPEHLCQKYEGIITPLEFERVSTRRNFPTWGELKEKFDEYEKKYLEKALGLANGNRSQAAKIAGIPYTSYLSKRQKFNLDFNSNI